MKLTKTEIKKNIFLISRTDNDLFYNSVVILSQDGPIIIDCMKSEESFNEILAFIQEKGYEKPNTIIYTHWHIDHSLGNYLEDVEIIAHEKTHTILGEFIENDLERLKSKGIVHKNSKPILPNITFKDRITLNYSDFSLYIFHSPGHTADSIMIYLKNLKLLISGDNLIGEEVPFFLPPVIPPDKGKIDSKALKNIYKNIQSMEIDEIIPGHGKKGSKEKLMKINRLRYEDCLKNKKVFSDRS